MKRIFREIKFHKGWFITLIILVGLACGVYIGFRSCYDSISLSFSKAYSELNTPDIIVFAQPISDISNEIKKINGVTMVSPAYLTDTYTFVDNRKIRGEVLGVEIGQRVNNYYVLQGRDLQNSDEVVVELHYAKNHNLKPSDKIVLYIEGKTVTLKVSGICFSPRYIYMFSKDGVLERDYGVFFVSREIFGGYANTFYVKVESSLKIDSIISSLKSFFAANGINATVARRDKLFNYMVVMEDIKSLNSLAYLFSTVLLATSAVILFVVLFRLTEKKRREIGTLRAMGFTKWSILQYFLTFSGLAFIIGIVLSIPLGLGILHFILGTYSSTLQIPQNFVIYRLNLYHITLCSTFTLFFFLAGSFVPSYYAASLAPANAIRPYLSWKKGARIAIKRRFSPLNKLILRSIFGHRVRSIGTMLVIALILSLGLSFALSMGSFRESIKQRFENNELWDIKVKFVGFMNESILQRLSEIQGVENVEPYSSSVAKLSFQNRSAFIQLSIMKPNTRMHAFQLSEGSMNKSGIIISRDVSVKLHASVGDEVELVTPFGKSKKVISGIIQEFGSSEAYIFENLTSFNGALIQIGTNPSEIESSLRSFPFVSTWVTKTELKESWLYFMNLFLSFVYAMDMVTFVLALITASVFAFLSAMEKQWSFTVLKAIGYTNKSILRTSMLEILVLSIFGTIVGVPLSMELASLFNRQFEAVMSGASVVLIPDLIFVRCVAIIIASLLSSFIITKQMLRRNISERIRVMFETM